MASDHRLECITRMTPWQSYIPLEIMQCLIVHYVVMVNSLYFCYCPLHAYRAIKPLVIAVRLACVVRALHSTGSCYKLQKRLQLAVESTLNFQLNTTVNTSLNLCHMACGDLCLAADNNYKINNNTSVNPPPPSPPCRFRPWQIFLFSSAANKIQKI